MLCISLEGELAMLCSCSFIRALSTVYSLFRFHFNFSLFQPIRHGNTKLSPAFLLQFTQCAKNWASRAASHSRFSEINLKSWPWFKFFLPESCLLCLIIVNRKTKVHWWVNIDRKWHELVSWRADLDFKFFLPESCLLLIIVNRKTKVHWWV